MEKFFLVGDSVVVCCDGEENVLSRREKRRVCIFWWEAMAVMWSRFSLARSWLLVWVKEGENGS